MTISRRDALNVAADVLARSDWLLVDRLAEGGDEHASENADRIVEILREEVARMGQAVCNCPAGANGRAPHWRICALYGQASNPVTATAPPPSGAAGATPSPLCTCPETSPEKRAGTYTVARLGMEPHAVTCPRWGTMPTSATPSVSDGGPTYATGGYVGPVDGARIRDTLQAASDRAHVLPPPLANVGVTRAGDVVGVYDDAGEVRTEFRPRSTSGPLDPEVHAALVRSVERGRREAVPGSRETDGDVHAQAREDARSAFLGDET